MYLPPLFAVPEAEELRRLIREYPLGMLVAKTDSGLEANHIPFLLEEGVLLAHVARANPVWRELAEGQDVLVVFRGEDGYISPNWYASKRDTERQVPTWNYEVVHVHGRIRVHEEPKFVRGVVARLTRQQEAKLPRPWKMSDAPAEYIDEELAHIVGLEVEVVRIQGKRKLSQNRERRDFDSAVQGLHESGQSALANAMLRARPEK
jgi:transcriptional regulator